MDIYNDYLAFKEDKYELLEFLASKESNIIARFKHVIIVVDFIYEKHCSNIKLSNDEEDIITVGYEYIFSRMNLIDLMLTKIFNNNKDEMEKFSKTISLILYVNDFIDEVTIKDENNKESLDKLSQYEDKILKLLEKKEHATDVEFCMLNDISIDIFDELNIEYYGLNEIFYDIALELGLIDEDESELEFEI